MKILSQRLKVHRRLAIIPFILQLSKTYYSVVEVVDKTFCKILFPLTHQLILLETLFIDVDIRIPPNKETLKNTELWNYIDNML